MELKSAEIRKYIERMTKQALSLMEKRDALAEQLLDVVAQVETRGIDKRAFREYVRVQHMTEDKRARYLNTRRQLAQLAGWEDGTQIDAFEEAPPIEADIEFDPDTGEILDDPEDVASQGDEEALAQLAAELEEEPDLEINDGPEETSFGTLSDEELRQAVRRKELARLGVTV